MIINLRSLLKENLYNVEFIHIFSSRYSDPVAYEYADIFSNDIFNDFLLDSNKLSWFVFIDGLGSLNLSIIPKRG